MNKQLTLIGIVTLNAAAVVSIIGCRSTSGMEAESARSFTLEPGSSAFTAPSSRTVTVSQSAPPPAAVPTHPASPVDEPANPPGAEPVEPVSAVKTASQPLEPNVSEEPRAVGAGRTYVVKSNDSLWVIARREHVSIDELASANGIRRNAVLRPGQKLVVPASSGKKSVAHNKAAPAVSGNTYTVVSGDALSIIARKLHTTTAALRAANPQVKNDAIRAGQKLNVPNGATKPAGNAVAPAAKPVSGGASAPASNGGGLDLPEIAPLGGAPASAPVPEAVPATPSTNAPAPEAVDATPVSR